MCVFLVYVTRWVCVCGGGGGILHPVCTAVFSRLAFCLWLFCLRWGPQSQLSHLRQFNLFTSHVAACVPPAAILSEAEDAVSVSPDLQLLLRFVKGSTGIHSDVGARVCLNRLVAHVYVCHPAASKVRVLRCPRFLHAVLCCGRVHVRFAFRFSLMISKHPWSVVARRCAVTTAG